MLARAVASAALALLIGGDAARLGWDAFGPWHFFFPYLWLFLLLEAARSRRRVDDGAAFLAGAAMALLHGGLYAKDLQQGFHPLGIDWLGALEACFDGGMTAVLALHALDALRPRREASARAPGPLVFGVLALVLAGAVGVYGIKTAFNFYRAERLLGPTWFLSDALFAAAAWALARRALRPEPSRQPWIFILAGFAVWLPGARFAARLCQAAGLPDALLYFFAGFWTLAAGLLFWGAWTSRAGFEESAPAPRSKAALAAALWRPAGALLLLSLWGSAQSDGRVLGAFSALVSLPTRALFAWAFLNSRLKV